MLRFTDLLKRFRKDERGVFLVIFALLAVVLIATSGAVVDFSRVQQARTKAQIAVDAAALALQSTIGKTGVTAATLKTDAQDLLTERMADTSITAVVESATPNVSAGRLTISGYITVPTYFVQLVGIKTIRSNMMSEVTRQSSDIEVSVSLDVTGSMAATYNWWGVKTSDKIGDLISATNTLIDLLVSDTQTPTYSKMAIVPWSRSVNVSSTYANSVRGAATGGVSISSATWMSGSNKTISAITQASPARVTTTANHGWAVDDYVYITGVSGMTNLNGNIYRVKTVPSSTRITLKTTAGADVNSTGWTAFSTSGSPRIAKCLNSSCQVLVTTSAAHNIPNNGYAHITGTSGMTSVNDVTWQTTLSTTTAYYLQGSNPTNGIRTSGGTSYCTVHGCQYFRFTNDAGGTNVWQVNTCVSERTSNAYTDAAPSGSPLGKNYRDAAGTACISQVIQPLTSNKTTLHALANSLTAEGATAGHLGLAWGWYMVAPNFAYLWPTDSRPKAYGSDNLIKAIVFMTDGVFNIPYCSSVAASDVSGNAVSDSEQINCASPNGSPKSQAQSICDAIKVASNKTLLYVIGFDLAGDTTSLNFLKGCATSVDYFFQADDGTDLTNAFKAIAQSLSELRISK